MTNSLINYKKTLAQPADGLAPLQTDYVSVFQEVSYFEELETINDDNKIDENDYLKYIEKSQENYADREDEKSI